MVSKSRVAPREDGDRECTISLEAGRGKSQCLTYDENFKEAHEVFGRETVRSLVIVSKRANPANGPSTDSE